jgi:hypothetical protein
MKTIISISILLFLSSVFYSCKRVTEERTIELNQIFDMKAKKWYKCEIGQDSTFYFKITKVEDYQAYGSACETSWGGSIKVYFVSKLNGEEAEFSLSYLGCSGSYVPNPNNPNLPYHNVTSKIKFAYMKTFPFSETEKKPSRLGLYDFRMILLK